MSTNFLRFKNLHGHIPDSELENAVSIKIQPSGVKRPFRIEAICPSATIIATDSTRPKRDIEKFKKRCAALRLKKKVIEDAREKGEEEFLVARNNTGMFRAAQKRVTETKEQEREGEREDAAVIATQEYVPPLLEEEFIKDYESLWRPETKEREGKGEEDYVAEIAMDRDKYEMQKSTRGKDVHARLLAPLAG